MARVPALVGDRMPREVFGVAQATYDGCLPACVATLLGVPLSSLPTVDHTLGSPEWFERYSDRVAVTTGFELMALTLKRRPLGLWIASIPATRSDGKHAVVMCADELVWDPYRPRPRSSVTLGEVEMSIIAVPTDPRRCLTFDRNLCTVSGSPLPEDDLRRIA